MARVKDIRFEGTFMIVEYTDCTTKEFNLCVECPEVPIEDNPGDWPDPITDPATRCRVATHVGLAAAQRLNNFLSGLNLNTSALNIFEAYAAAKIVEYGWDINLWDDVVNFCISLYNGLSSGRGLDAKNDWDASSTDDTTNSQEALYCALDDTGELQEPQRAQWSLNLTSAFTGDFEGVLADFLQIWPLAQLREMAFAASTNTAAVNCAAFDCGESPEPCVFEDTFFAVYDGADEGYWSTPPAQYLGHTSRNFSTGTCILQLPSPVCITKIRVSHAGQSGTAWKKIQVFIDNVPYPIQNDKQHTSCNTNDQTSNFWIINPPMSGSEIKFVGTELASGSTGNPNAPAVIHCVRIDYGI